MNRFNETLDTIGETKKAIYGSVEKPTLFLIPILSQIALSLAVKADKYTEEDEREQDALN